MIHPLIGIILALVALGAITGMLHVWQRRGSAHPETTRKAMHVSMGLVALSFPWLFDAVWPVLTLGLLSVAALLSVRLATRIRKNFGGMLHDVQRVSLGEIYFPLSICFLFILSHAQPYGKFLYCAPLLVLTLADAVAALIGVRFGHTSYTTAEGRKSLEGSLAFLLAGFVSVAGPALLLTDEALWRVALVAANVGMVTMLLEAIALRGRDNLYLPMAAYALLKTYLDLPSSLLLVRLLAILLLLAVLIAWRKRTTMDDSAALGAALAAYVTWAACGWPWLIPPLILLFTYTWVFPNPYAGKRGPHTIHAVISITAAGFVWALCNVWVGAEFGPVGFYYLYAIAYAAQMAMIGVAALIYAFPLRPISHLILRGAVTAALLVLLPSLLVITHGPRIVLPFAYGLICVLLAASTFAYFRNELRQRPLEPARWVRQALIGFIFSAAGVLLLA